MVSTEKFMELSTYFKSRLELIPSCFISTKVNTVEEPQRKLTKKEKLEKKRKRDREYRNSFQPMVLPTIPLPGLQPSSGVAGEMKVEERMESVELKSKLHEKMETLRLQTGTNKVKKKTKTERKVQRAVQKERQKRRLRGKAQRKHKAEEPIRMKNVQHSDLKGISKPKKKKKLDESLRRAERERECEESFAATGEGGEKVLSNEWRHALDRAAGVRVLDDPKKIKKRMEDEMKRRVKSAKKWKERNENLVKEKEERQKKRQRNLKLRSEKRKSKKLRQPI